MKKLIVLLFLVAPASLVAQVCNDAIAQNAFLARYDVDLADPTIVTDTATSLEWQRCLYGYVLNDQDGDTDITTHTCDVPEENTDDDADTFVPVSFLWYSAVETAADAGDGWRLPNLKELSSLIEFGCYNPAINIQAFPDTPTTNFWTNTPFASGNSEQAVNVWTIDFSDGSDDDTSKGTSLPMRLVRD